jgi:hypothetical protein
VRGREREREGEREGEREKKVNEKSLFFFTSILLYSSHLSHLSHLVKFREY